MSEPGDSGYDFDELARLAKSDPERFEARRRALVRQVIDVAPEHLKPRLEGLQWQIDCVRRQSSSPLGACLKISNLMWEQVLGQGGLVDALQEAASAGTLHAEQRPAATVLNFGPSDEDA